MIELKELNDKWKATNKEVQDIKTELTVLKTRFGIQATLLGAIAGGLISFLVIKLTGG